MDGVYNFKARMNLSMRIRHYWSNVTYRSFYDVAADGSWIDKPFQDGYDENFNLFNLDMFFTWDFASEAGSWWRGRMRWDPMQV
jgi:hypothetical protein